MRRGAALFLMLSVASSCASAGAWSDLWSTHEQQGQRLLQQHPDQAAKLFSDPRRRGYAELAAGHYPQAAELLKPFGDADSLYNRGNALARSGQLKDALAAYDAALKQAPRDADIRHNRDLVAQALKGQPPQKAPQQGGQQAGKDGQGQPKDNKNNGGKDKDSHGQNQGQQSGSQNGQDAGQHGGQNGQGPQQPSQNSPGNQDSRQAQRAQESQGGSGGQQPQSAPGQQPQGSSGSSPQSRQAAAGQSNSPPDNQGRNAAGNPSGRQDTGQGALQSHGQSSAASSNPGDLARQAQADAAAGAQYLRDQKNARGNTRGPDIDDPRHAARTAPPSPPPSEESLALDQWLQRIPEDSAELLRRKFRIEHNMRHPEQDVEP